MKIVILTVCEWKYFGHATSLDEEMSGLYFLYSTLYFNLQDAGSDVNQNLLTSWEHY